MDIIKGQKKITDTKLDRVLPSKSKVTGEKDWKVLKEMMTQGATAFRLFRHDTEEI